MIENKNIKFLINIPLGKSYISNPFFFKPQLAQKGETCWYYVLNYIRNRYGKDFPDQNYLMRREEKIISSHRKKIVAIEKKSEKLLELLMSMQFEYQIDEVDKAIVKKRLDFYIANNLLFEDEIKIYKKFLSQPTQDNFENYINEEIQNDYIENCKTL